MTACTSGELTKPTHSSPSGLLVCFRKAAADSECGSQWLGGLDKARDLNRLTRVSAKRSASSRTTAGRRV